MQPIPNQMKRKQINEHSPKRHMKRPPLSEHIPKYTIENGIRSIQKYPYTLSTYTKQRWLGKTITSVYTAEFNDRPHSYYKSAIVNGAITVNQQTVNPDYVMRDGDLVEHTVCRHEPNVTGEKIEIVFVDNDTLVVNKPSGIPVPF